MIRRRLRCFLFGHDWVVRVVTVEVWPLHHGYTLVECRRCPKRLRNQWRPRR